MEIIVDVLCLCLVGEVVNWKRGVWLQIGKELKWGL